ncbi:MAG TPA: EamA family transporter [Gemmatimonadaceae bacterium]|nr:EamA family transporter [Gemmatimonadaceae bacterium]
MSTTKSEGFGALDWGLLLSTSLIWGSSFLFIRLAVTDIRPGLIVFLRLALGVATLAAFPASRRPVPWSAWPRIAAVGISWMTVPFFLFSVALQWIDSSVAGMLNGAVPLFVAIIASAVARRLPGWRQQLGLFIGLAGVVIVSLPSIAGAKATALGIALVLVATVCYGIAVNLTAPLQKQHGALPVIWRAEIVAMVLLVPMGAAGLGASSFSVTSVLALVALGALGTGIGFATFVTLVGRVGPTRASVTAYLMPLVAMVAGALVRHEPLGASAFVGTILILAGAFLVSRPDRSRQAAVSLAKAAVVLAMLAGAHRAWAQEPTGAPISAKTAAPTAAPERARVWSLPRLGKAARIVVDGSADDAAWQLVPRLPLTVYLPVYGSAPVERTDARIAYDAEALYVMIDAWEAHPGGIRASSMIRDDDAPGDFVNVLIDPFGDRKNAVAFSTTPGGQRNDWTIINDAAGANPLSPGWNAVWDLATRRDGQGWHAEFRIPFSTLRFTTHDGRVEFGLGINRLAAHVGERVIFPATEPSSGMSLWKPSNLQRVSVDGISSTRSVRLTPYAVAGREGLRAPDVVASPWASNDRVDMGGDLKMALSANLTLDVTANTDFAEAEVDDQRVNLTRYPLLFPERRQFFVEQAGTFEVKTGESDLLFHSRRVGLTAAGEPVRLLGGARLAGRVGAWDVGFFDAQMGREAGVTANNLGVLRLRRSMSDPRSWLGVMATSRIATDSSQTAIGVDGELHVAGDDYVTFAAATLAGEPGAGANEGLLPRGSLRFLAERRRNRSFFYRAGVSTIGARYAPALGYVERADAIRPLGEMGYGRVVSSAGHVLRGGVTSAFVYRNADAAFDASQVAAVLELELPTGAVGKVSVTQQDDDLLVPFAPTNETSVPVGRYAARYGRLDFTPSGGSSMVVGGTLRGGEFYDGTLYSATVSPEWRASAHLRVGADVQLDRLDFQSRDQREWSKLARLRVLAAASPRLMLTTVVQASSVARLGQVNARLRYNLSEGHDLWIVYTHLANLERDRTTPLTPATARAGLLVKYTRSYGT